MKAASVVTESPIDCPRVRQCRTGADLLLSENIDACHSVVVQTTPSDKSGPIVFVDMVSTQVSGIEILGGDRDFAYTTATFKGKSKRRFSSD